MILLWSLLHESGEEKGGEWPLGPVNQKPQSLGSAITYGRRYCFTAVTNIVLEDDDDGQRAQQDHGSRQTAGDAWENATPATPRERQRPPPEDGRPWAEAALEQAGRIQDRGRSQALARSRSQPGKCTPKQKDHIQNIIAAASRSAAGRRPTWSCGSCRAAGLAGRSRGTRRR